MTQPRLFAPVLLAVSLAAGSAPAAPVHAPYAPFSVEINPSSTGLSPLAGFNGNRADFTGFGVANYYPAPFTQVVQTLSATFLADPGHVFTGASIGVGQWSYVWMNGSGIGFNVQWSIPGATYAGGDSGNAPLADCSNSGIGTWWTGSGSEGCLRKVQGWSTQGGGGLTELPMMGGEVPILLDNVASFTVEITADIWAGGSGFFGDFLTSGFGFSTLGVQAFYAEGEPASAVPEPATMLPAALALLALARRRGAARKA